MVQLIIGHVTIDSAKIWIKGSNAANSAILRLEGKDNFVKTIDVLLDTAAYSTGVATIEGLSADTLYQCTVDFSDQRTVFGSFKTFPVLAQTVSFLLASCHFSQGTDHVSPEFTRIAAIANAEASRFQVNCGDQIYIDTAIRPFWVTSQDQYRERYEETWHSGPLQYLFGNLPQYMIIDDHEIFNDFSNDDLNNREQEWLTWATNTYSIFQHSHNPASLQNGALYYTFNCAHAGFFVMDTRTERTGNQMISERQLTELKKWINNPLTKNAIKFIVSSVPLFTQLSDHQQKDKWSGKKYIGQRDKVLKLIMSSSNKHITLLSGDIHLSSHAWIEYEAEGKKYQINELTSSPIKQIQANLLLHKTPEQIIVDSKPTPYFLGKHMGYPVNAGEKRHALRNNIMSITVGQEGLGYKVFAVNGEDLLFEDSISFNGQ